MLSKATRSELATPNTQDRVLATLRSIGLSESDIARATGANVRTVRRWSSGEAQPQPEYAERLDDLRTVVAELGTALPPEAITAWLRGRNLAIDRTRPLDLLSRGEFDRVAAVAEKTVEGEFS